MNTFGIDDNVMKNVKEIVLGGASTRQGIAMLGLPTTVNDTSLNVAGNTYLNALFAIRDLLERLNSE